MNLFRVSKVQSCPFNFLQDKLLFPRRYNFCTFLCIICVYIMNWKSLMYTSVYDTLPWEAITIHKPTMYTLHQFRPPSEQLYIRGANLCCDITQCMPQETNTVVVLSLLLFNGVVKGGRHCIACTGNAVSSLQPFHSHNVPTNAPQMLACSDSTVGAPFSPHPLIWG